MQVVEPQVEVVGIKYLTGRLVGECMEFLCKLYCISFGINASLYFISQLIDGMNFYKQDSFCK